MRTVRRTRDPRCSGRESPGNPTVAQRRQEGLDILFCNAGDKPGTEERNQLALPDAAPVVGRSWRAAGALVLEPLPDVVGEGRWPALAGPRLRSKDLALWTVGQPLRVGSGHRA